MLRSPALLLLTLAVTFAAGGCGHVPVGTMYKLWSFDVATADASAIRAAIRFPAALSPRPGGAKLTVTSKDRAGNAPKVMAFVLEVLKDPAEIKELDRLGRTGSRVTAFKLSGADIETVRRLQSEILYSRKTSENRSGSFGVSIDACHLGGIPNGALLSSTFLKLDSAGGYMPLLEDIDLRKEIGDAALSEHIPSCAK